MKKYIAVIILAIGLGAVVESQTSYIYWTVGLNTPRVATTTLNVTGVASFADGTVAAPSITFASDLDTGIHYHTGDNSVRLVFDGVGRHILTLNQWQLNSNSAQLMLGTSSADAAVLTRDAANVLALKNGTNAQEFRVYGTTEGSKYVKLAHSGTSGTIDSSSGALYLRSGGQTAAVISTNALTVGGNADLIFATDNTRDIGQVAEKRPRNVYIAGAYYGNGANLTGIAGATGGVSNTVNTNIVADNDSNGSGIISFDIGSASRWQVGNDGHFMPGVHQTYDIGASGQRPRVVYAGTLSSSQAVVDGGNVPAVGRLRLGGGTQTNPTEVINAAVTWNDAADTFTAWKLNVTDTASAQASKLMDLQVGGTSIVYVQKNGTISAQGVISVASWAYFQIGARGTLAAPADGQWVLKNSAGNDFSRLMFGGTTDAFPALKRTAADIEIVGAAAGITSGLIIQSIKATSGTRFVCVDTNGKLVSSATACSGT